MTEGTSFLALLVYVDDMVIAGNDTLQIQKVKSYLSTCFSIKDLGTLKYFLGLELARSPQGISLCQRKYTLDLLKETGMSGSKPAAFPIPQQHRLSLDCGEPLKDPSQYRRLIGRLIYLTISRPDITYAVQLLSQFMQRPCLPHLDAAHHVIRYLKNSPGQGLFFPSNSDFQITAYCDADWASCPMSRRSITGYYIFLGGAPISWKSKKQSTVSRSSAESEYRSMAATTSELIWLRGLLGDLCLSHSQPMYLHCDNQSALHIAANPVFHERTKHIEIDCHFIREHLQSGTIATKYVPTQFQLADILTKALGRDRFHFLLRKLGIQDLHAPT